MNAPKLCSAADITGWLGCTENQLRRHYVNQPEWPKAVTPPRSQWKDRRWYEAEVIDAIERLRNTWRKAA